MVLTAVYHISLTLFLFVTHVNPLWFTMDDRVLRKSHSLVSQSIQGINRKRETPKLACFVVPGFAASDCALNISFTA